jgi:hypothetical protein
MLLAAECIPSLLQLMLGRPSHSGIGNRTPRFPVFGGDFPIPDSRVAGNRESGIGKTGRFPIGRETGIGVPIRRAGGFLVWQRGLRESAHWQPEPVEHARARAPLAPNLNLRSRPTGTVAGSLSCPTVVPVAYPTALLLRTDTTLERRRGPCAGQRRGPGPSQCAPPSLAGCQWAIQIRSGAPLALAAAQGARF